METTLSDKTIVITGATGLIGSHLVRELLRRGAEVRALGRSVEKMERVFANEKRNIRFSYSIGELSLEFLKKLGKIDYIFHAASPISGEEIKYHPVDVIAANIDGARVCLDFLRKQKEEHGYCGRMIIFSSATVYGKTTEDRTVVESQTEIAGELCKANAPYSESKRMVEVIAKAYNRQYGVDCVIARMGYVYGYTKIPPATAFYEFINKGLQGDNITVNNAGIPRRDNIYVSDVVNGLILLAEKGVVGEAYNISSNGEKGNYCAADELGEYIVNEINTKIKSRKIMIKRNLKKGVRESGIKLNNSKLKELGWKLETSIADGIRETLEQYYREYEKGSLENKC